MSCEYYKKTMEYGYYEHNQPKQNNLDQVYFIIDYLFL